MCRITLMESVRQVAQWNHEAKQIADEKYTYKGIIAAKKKKKKPKDDGTILYNVYKYSCNKCSQSKQVTVKLSLDYLMYNNFLWI